MSNIETHFEHQVQTNIMHNRRHPMRQTLTRIEDLYVDPDNEVNISDLNDEIRQIILKMAAHKSSDPGFWLLAFKFLNNFKDDIYTRLWTGADEADHQARVVLAQRSAAIQIRLLIRDKNLPTALKSALTYLFGPAMALLMLRHDQDRDSRTLINAMQLVHEVIETFQEPANLQQGSCDQPLVIGLKMRLQEFFSEVHGIGAALSPQALLQMQGEEYFFIKPFDDIKDIASSVEISKHETNHELSDVLETAHLSSIARVAATNKHIENPLHASEVQKPVNRMIKTHRTGAQSVSKEVPLHPANELKSASLTEDSSAAPADAKNRASLNNLIAVDRSPAIRGEPITIDSTDLPRSDEARKVFKADKTELKSTPRTFNLSAEYTPNKVKEPAVIIDPALENLLEHLQVAHHLNWFQIQVEKNSSVRRLMFQSYDRKKQSITFVNVHQKPSLVLSASDFDVGLRNGLTHPLYAEPAINKLLLEYLRLGSTSQKT